MIPGTIDAAVVYLKEQLADDLVTIKCLDKHAVLAAGHHGVGQWIRNNWGFWTEDSELYVYLHGLGLSHADDMSGIILTALWCDLHEEPFDVRKEVQKYLEYWESTRKDSKMEPVRMEGLGSPVKKQNGEISIALQRLIEISDNFEELAKTLTERLKPVLSTGGDAENSVHTPQDRTNHCPLAENLEQVSDKLEDTAQYIRSTILERLGF